MNLKRVYLPKWIPWFVLILALLTIAFGYYELQQNQENFDNFIFSILIFVVIVFVLFFVSYRQIPYLLVEVK